MIHDVSIPAALIAGLVSFLSPCVLPLVPPYLIYLTGATIEHVANDETVSSSKRAVMISAAMFVLGFSTVFVALGASASLIGGLVHAWSAELADCRRHRHHRHGPAFSRADANRVPDAGRAVADTKAGGSVGRLCDGARLCVRLDALHRADPRGHPVDRRRRGDGDEGREPARGLFRRARHSVSDRGLHGRAVLHAVLADEAAPGQCRAGDGRADDHHRHRLSHRRRDQCEHLATGDVSGLQNFG